MPKQSMALRFASEGVLIVGSILLAFGIDAWWDGRQEGVREESALSALHAEFSENRRLLVQTRDLQAAAREEALSLLALFRSQGDPAGSFQVPDALLYSIGTTRQFLPVTGALSSLLNSGDLGLISDEGLRSALSAWPDRIALLMEREGRARDTSFGILVPLLHEFVPYTTLDYRAGVEGVSGPSAFQGDYEGLLTSLVAENWVEMRQFGLLGTLRRYEELIDEVDEILLMIEGSQS